MATAFPQPMNYIEIRANHSPVLTATTSLISPNTVPFFSSQFARRGLFVNVKLIIAITSLNVRPRVVNVSLFPREQFCEISTPSISLEVNQTYLKIVLDHIPDEIPV